MKNDRLWGQPCILSAEPFRISRHISVTIQGPFVCLILFSACSGHTGDSLIEYTASMPGRET